MDDSEKPITNAEAEITTGGDEGKDDADAEGMVDSGGVLETGPSSVESVLKPVVEELTQAAKSFVPSCVTEVENELVEKLAHVCESPSLTLPASDAKVGESTEVAKSASAEVGEGGLDENTRSTNTQPFLAVAAGTPASWMNCCGLLDVLRPSDQ